MPGQNRTGPLGLGALTGRELGPCGCGMQRRFGRGFGREIGFKYTKPAVLTEAEEKRILEAELKEIDLEKQEIEKRLKDMK